MNSKTNETHSATFTTQELIAKTAEAQKMAKDLWVALVNLGIDITAATGTRVTLKEETDSVYDVECALSNIAYRLSKRLWSGK